MSRSETCIIRLENITHSFSQSSAAPKHLVLDDISLELPARKIIALLGKSGSGKSTILRIIAGLIKPEKGLVSFPAHMWDSPLKMPATSMIFQSFALLPWRTVFENVALGIEAQGVAKGEIYTRTMRALNLIGLDGYEASYPKELSGGMRQRVGFARAIVMNPEVLLMDEPFSALDVLTAENLRGDLLDLWIEKITPLKSILLVTHNIEESLMLADKICLLSSNPGQIVAEITVDLPHPRDKQSGQFQSYVKEIYNLMTNKLHPGSSLGKSRISNLISETNHVESLPNVPPLQFAGFLDVLASTTYNGSADITTIASALQLSYDETGPLLEALKILHFVDVDGTVINISPSGRIFSEGNAGAQKKVLAEHLIKHVPMASMVRRMLAEQEDKKASIKAVTALIASKCPDGVCVKEMLATLITWGAYAGLFSHDKEKATLHLRK